MLIVGLAVGAQRIPHWEGDAEEPLTANEPVAIEPLDPVLITVTHVLRDPLKFPAALQQGVAQIVITPTVADVPLPGADDLQRLVALLVEVGFALGRLGLTVHLAGLHEGFNDELTGGEGGLARDCLVFFGGSGVDDPLRGLGEDPSVTTDDGAGGQLQFPPPSNVGEVTEGTAHGDAGALVHLSSRVSQHRHLDPVQRSGDGGAEEVLIALVVGVSDEGAASGQQLGPGGFDEDVLTVGTVEAEAVVSTGVVASLELSLGDGGGEGDVPQSGGVRQVRLATGVVAEEGQLGDPLRLWRDRRVELVPVHRQADSPPQVLESFFIDGGQLDAQLDEVATANWHLTLGVGFARRGEVGVVRQRGITAHAVVVLHATLSRKTVVVPTHRVKNLLATHPLIAGNSVGVGVGEDVTGMQVA